MKRFTPLIAGTAVVLGLVTARAEVAPDDVRFEGATVKQSLTGQPGDPARGREWVAGRKLGNCLACHRISDLKDQPFHGEIGPALDGVADRYSEEELRAILVNPKKVFGEDTIMPAFYRSSGLRRVMKKFQGKTILTAQQVEDVIAYLKTLKE